MTTSERYLEQWRAAGAIEPDQAATLRALVRKERFSIHLELNALLYLGVVAFAGGLAWTVREHFAQLGDAAVLVTVAALFGGSLTYCYTHAAPYSNARVDTPNLFFDYVLYLGCLSFGVGLGYVEFRFHLLKDNWDVYLLASSILYFALAYRFDNRFVLSLALSALAGWFGVRLAAWHVLPETMRGVAVLYGLAVAAIGALTNRRGVKAHFLDAYLHVSANAILLALASGAMEHDAAWPWMPALLVVAAAVVYEGVRERRFAFVAYGVVYAYLAVGVRVTHLTLSDTAILTYFVVSGGLAATALGITAVRFGREP